jgi:hypothetical protein
MHIGTRSPQAHLDTVLCLRRQVVAFVIYFDHLQVVFLFGVMLSDFAADPPTVPFEQNVLPHAQTYCQGMAPAAQCDILAMHV